jgi:hypothetical protein
VIDAKQALNIQQLVSTTGTNLRSHSITTFNHYDRRIREMLRLRARRLAGCSLPRYAGGRPRQKELRARWAADPPPACQATPATALQESLAPSGRCR